MHTENAIANARAQACFVKRTIAVPSVTADRQMHAIAARQVPPPWRHLRSWQTRTKREPLPGLVPQRDKMVQRPAPVTLSRLCM